MRDVSPVRSLSNWLGSGPSLSLTNSMITSFLDRVSTLAGRYRKAWIHCGVGRVYADFSPRPKVSKTSEARESTPKQNGR